MAQSNAEGSWIYTVQTKCHPEHSRRVSRLDGRAEEILRLRFAPLRMTYKSGRLIIMLCYSGAPLRMTSLAGGFFGCAQIDTLMTGSE